MIINQEAMINELLTDTNISLGVPNRLTIFHLQT